MIIYKVQYKWKSENKYSLKSDGVVIVRFSHRPRIWLISSGTWVHSKNLVEGFRIDVMYQFL